MSIDNSFSTSEMQSSINDIDVELNTGLSSIAKFCNHLDQTEPIYAELLLLKNKGWNNPEADAYFQEQKQRADTVNKGGAINLYRMMQQIGDEMQCATGALSLKEPREGRPQILDLCMAPGGYTSSALKYNQTARACGITLDPKQGGHKVLLKSPRATVRYHDITMFAAEFGVDQVPTSHPEYGSFSVERPYNDQIFDLVFCDGQVLRTHARAKYREPNEAHRLTSAQLILALQRIRQGGTFIMLLRQIQSFGTMELLYMFSRFSGIEVFKSKKKHTCRGTFYLIAKDMQPYSPACKEAIATWKKAWWNATFAGEHGTGATKVLFSEAYVQEVIDSFGSKLASLARPIWQIQLEALKKKDWTK